MIAEAVGQMLYILVWLMYNPTMRSVYSLLRSLVSTLVFIAVILITMAAFSIGMLSVLGVIL